VSLDAGSYEKLRVALRALVKLVDGRDFARDEIFAAQRFVGDVVMALGGKVEFPGDAVFGGYRAIAPGMEPPTPALPTYGTEAKCAKCGYDNHSDRYNDQTDTIERRCCRCGFTHKVLPLDR
jgi:hypothetical protein